MPADVKAATTGDGSILLVWRRPLHSNGVLTKYTILMKDMSDRQVTALVYHLCVVVNCCQRNDVHMRLFTLRIS